MGAATGRFGMFLSVFLISAAFAPRANAVDPDPKTGKRIKSRWLWFFDENEKDATQAHNKRDDFLDLVGMSARPSFAASLVAFLDSPKGDPPENVFYNAIGKASHMSKFTMQLIFLRLFEYGILWSDPKIALYKGEATAKESGLSENIKTGLSVMMSIIKSLEGDDEANPFFPKFETYWPRGSFK